MSTSGKKQQQEEDLKAIMQHTDASRLHRFIADYAAKHPEFKKEFLSVFNPQTAPETKKEYVRIIEEAFSSNARTRGGWRSGSYGYDAAGIAADLYPLQEKARFYMQHGNYDAAILICCTLIETIPGEFEGVFDHDGDIQVVYDEAINMLHKMLEKKHLSAGQVTSLFDWYSREQKLDKHKDVGLNTELKVLDEFFTGTPDMLRQTLKNIDERIKSAGSDYQLEEAVLDKIRLLQKEGMTAEAEAAITQYMHLPDVRRLRVDGLINKKHFARAIDLLNEGIKIALEKKHPGIANNWKERLLEIYTQQHDTASVLSCAEDLLLNGRDAKKYYGLLKELTPQKEWPSTVERLLAGMGDGRLISAGGLRADILIEHKMWDRLFDLCKNSRVEVVEHYEKYLKPFYAKEIFDIYHRYVESQALITDPQAYKNVARLLGKMKQYPGGPEVVNQLLLKYRELYKRRKLMMEELKKV